jgi:hypothetical protein
MENGGGKFSSGPETEFGRILNRDLFLFLLDLEVKRAQRYQNFLCLIILKIKQSSRYDNGWDFHTGYETLSTIVGVEMRESDILGSLNESQLVVLLPYADSKAGSHARSRFEDTLKYYNFKNKGFEVTIDQVCFPLHGTNTTDLIRVALGTES